MASSPVTAPPSDGSSSPPSPPSPPSSNGNSNSTSSSPPPTPPTSTSPPPSSPPPTPSTSSPPPPDKTSPPPSSGGDSSTQPPPSSPPPTSSGSQPPKSSPSSGNNGPPPNTGLASPPPPSSSSTKSPPPPSSGGTMLAPPPPSHKAPSTKSVPAKNSDNSPSFNNKISSSMMIGIAAGAVIIFLLAIVFCVTCKSRRKKKKRIQMQQYYGDYSRGGHNGPEYYNGQQKWHNQNHHGNVPLPPGMSPNLSNSGGNYGAPLPPLLPSSEMTNSFSPGLALPPPAPNLALGFNKSTFTYDELATATNGFSQANLLGQGGFGYVHKGLLPNGKEIAVKSLKSGSGQGEREFQAEVEIISRVHHRHLVSLVGYCIAETRRMLVYEFVSNNTMEYHLHGKDRPTMDWATRHRIALGSAKGLAYLHEDCHPRIIHRDIKAANILLDDNFEAMVADFGLAKLSSDNNTHVSTRVMGTFGYLAPEYASSGKLTEKSDVFSFGVMLLELITGRRPVDVTGMIMEDSLADWARPILNQAMEDHDFEELVDPRLGGNYNPQELPRMAVCASAAIRHSGKRRPKMSQIVRILEGDASLDDLNDGIKSAVFSGSNASSDYDYNVDMKRFRKVALSSQEFGSSEHSSGESQELPPHNTKHNLPRSARHSPI